MDKKHKLVLVAVAAVAALLAAVPTTLVIKDRLETAERESLEQAALKIFQSDADLATAEWRSYEPPADKVWDKAIARAGISGVEMQGDRAKVWVDEFTTPYATDLSGKDAQPTEPYVSSHLFILEPAGDGWRLAEDLTKSGLYDG
ncbi:hypothetical protein OG763_03475 [Streptomyces sp. NBC_01230]|uniref:hypothetical protein n=1 Tax=Streptomyces sp. NBC_01230 TaxID=2903784 RepID=UPI002E133ACE|nr:hypothetical protein OG763_03475 [Streptomyces sp. NBC_01230]